MRLAVVFAFACSSTPTIATHSTLANTAEEAPGSNCANGGIMVATGVDADDSGTLDAGEVLTTAYVCNGAGGAPGASGLNGSDGTTADHKVLTRTTPEAAGAHCAYGGTKIEVGVDDDDDNALDAAEIDATAYACGDDPFAHILLGSLEIRSQQDVIDAQGLTSVFGDLRVHMAAAGTVSLPNLTLVQGRVFDCPDAGDSQATAIALPNAVSIIGGVQLSCSPALTSFDMRKVTSTARVSFDGSPLTSLNVSALRTVTNELNLRAIALTSLAIPALTYVGGDLSVRDGANFDDCSLITSVHAARLQAARLHLVLQNNVHCANETLRCPQVSLGAETGYRLCYYASNWFDAQAQCHVIGDRWRLTYFDDASQFDAITAAPQLVSPDMDYWIGLNDVEQEGVYSWSVAPAGATGATSWVDTDSSYAPTGAPFWISGEPNDFGGAEDCAMLRPTNGSLAGNDTGCGETNHYPLCRYHP